MGWFTKKKSPPENKMPPNLPTDPKELAEYQEFLRQKSGQSATTTPPPADEPEVEEIDPAEIMAAVDGAIAERDAALSAAVSAKAERDEAIIAKDAAIVERDAAVKAKATAEAKVSGLEQRAGGAEKERDAARTEAARVTAEFQKLGPLVAKLRPTKPKA